MGTIECLCISEAKGTTKTARDHVELKAAHGIVGDAHAGPWHRQVSILANEDIETIRKKGLPDLAPGAFAENIIVNGVDLSTLGLGSRLQLGGQVALSITQIGKVCHSRCQIFHKTGDCIMPRLGLFARVEQGGSLERGAQVTVQKHIDRSCFQCVVLTISDRCSTGETVDTAGPAVEKILLDNLTANIYRRTILPDEQDQIENSLKHYADGHSIDLVFTVGGTGFSPRDVTPEATRNVVERLTPGLNEAMRAASLQITPRAMLSRAVSGIRRSTLIVNLPGSKRAAEENLRTILPALSHGLLKLRGDPSDCG
ncbi:MAG: molybdopterin-binding protein [Candidatus Hinthialibacter antarcticus]|nr:molybdopterin-binding protein [Candidatus Hinthialibacter antarcticus]